MIAVIALGIGAASFFCKKKIERKARRKIAFRNLTERPTTH